MIICTIVLETHWKGSIVGSLLCFEHHIRRLSIPLLVSGSSSAVERQLPKLDVAGSIPVSRSIFLSITWSQDDLGCLPGFPL